MNLSNYRDIGRRGSDMHAGFQFEFRCANCTRTWQSPFKPYRRGQLAGFIHKFAYYLGDRGRMFGATNAVADAGAKGAHESALQDALELAAERYAECPSCEKIVCKDCWVAGAQLCEPCAARDGRPQRRGGSRADADGGAQTGAEGSTGLKCPNCSGVIGSGRFCAECGFDMASTHKSCPGCGTLCTRAARFCTDCGHGF